MNAPPMLDDTPSASIGTSDEARAVGQAAPSSLRQDDGEVDCSLVPRRSPWLYRGFSWYARRLCRKRLHAVRLSVDGPPPRVDASTPMVVFQNHPSWWDPLVGLMVAQHAYPDREHYAPIEAAMLEKYRVFEKIGFFGVSADKGGARAFLDTASAVLASPRPTIWITAEGAFSDPRRRPVELRRGLAHLAARAPSHALFVPMAVELAFWEESTPEALVRFGEPLPASSVELGRAGQRVRVWHRLLTESLTGTMNALADDAIARRGEAFQTILGGQSGVGGPYDVMRRLRAWLTGRSFDPSHGERR